MRTNEVGKNFEAFHGEGNIFEREKHPPARKNSASNIFSANENIFSASKGLTGADSFLNKIKSQIKKEELEQRKNALEKIQ
jgi:hypothetical protein